MREFPGFPAGTTRPKGMKGGICLVPGCDRKNHAKGLCNLHRQRLAQGVDLNQPLRESNLGRTCKFCERPSKGKGLCVLHLQRKRAGRPLDAPLGFNRLNPKRETKTGYKWIWDGTKKVLEHRDVMQKNLSRTLPPNEVVHHKNKDPKDNSLDNLQIMTPGEHTRHHHKITDLCTKCGKSRAEDKKSGGQGLCYVCYYTKNNAERRVSGRTPGVPQRRESSQDTA